MDTARQFKPETILLWRKVADEPEAQRILNLFPCASVKIIEQQRYIPEAICAGKALVAGKRILMIGQTQQFVNRFDGQPGENVRCLPYHKLVPISNGCPYYCAYCYLAFVYRKYSPFIKININYDLMFSQIRKALKQNSGFISFNMGEMQDSLALDHITGLSQMLVPFFGSLSNGYLMLLTKSSNVENLLSLEPNDRTVVSWSLNCEHNVKYFEKGTAGLNERIAAAKACQKHGYRIRFRIDPGILYPDWRAGYAELIDMIFKHTQPENITLGMLRLLPGHPQLAQAAYGTSVKKMFQFTASERGADFKIRYNPQDRIEFYKFVVDTIRQYDKEVSISLCRETPQIWQALSSRCDFGKCNCLVW
ncbi:MAG: spore photoproduct lyase family protein [Phycisphaerae bacterium]|jgi:spore photoproduct lyase